MGRFFQTSQPPGRSISSFTKSTCMKRVSKHSPSFMRIIATGLILCTLSLISCEKDEDFHQISNVERSIHNGINDFREDQGLNRLVEQFLLFKDARDISNGLANGTYQPGSDDISAKVQEISANLGGSGSGWITLVSSTNNPDSIVHTLLEDESTANIYKLTYTQSGVGMSEGSDGLFYICHVLINIPD